MTRTADHELSEESSARFQMLKKEIDMTVRGVIEDGMADGSLRKGDVRLVTFTATGALNWIARWFDPKGPLTAEEVAEGVVATLFAGLAEPSATRPCCIEARKRARIPSSARLHEANEFGLPEFAHAVE